MSSLPYRCGAGRGEFRRGLAGLGEDDARRRIPPMNCISWNIGHLAWQEQAYWLYGCQGRMLLPAVDEQFATRAPASAPPLAEVWEAWHAITVAADSWLDALTTADLLQPRTVALGGETIQFTGGNLMQRVIYHYWYHTGENLAIRQMLGHPDLPEFVGNIDDEAPYRPE